MKLKNNKIAKIAQRLGVLVFEIVAVTVAVVLVALIVLGLRLQEKPLQINSLTPVIEEMMNRNKADLRFSIGGTALKWQSFRRPASIVLSDIQVRNVHNLDVASVKDLGVSFSIPHLLVGRLRPVSFSVIEPDIFFYRDIEGNITVDLAAVKRIEKEITEKEIDDDEYAILEIPDAQTSKATEDVFRSIIDGFINPENTDSLIGELQEMEILSAKILFADLKKQQFWDMPAANIRLLRSVRGLEAETDIQVRHDLGDFNVQGRIRHGYDFDSDAYQQGKTRTFADLTINHLNPDLLIQNFDFLQGFEGSRADIDLNVSLVLTADFDVDLLKLGLVADDGVVALDGVIDEPVDFRKLVIDLLYDADKQRLISEKIMLDTGRIELLADLDIDWAENTRPMAVLQAGLKEMATADLSRYWPRGAADNARDWVLENIRDGGVKGATIEIIAYLPAHYNFSATKPTDEANGGFELVSLQGAFNYHGLTIDYLAPLPAVTGVEGSAQFDEKKFLFDVTNGQAGKLNFGRSRVILTGLDIGKEAAEISINGMNGTLPALLHILDMEPLGFIEHVGLKPSDFSGKFRGDLSLSFPLLADLRLEDVNVSAKGTAKADEIKNLYRDHDFTQGDLAFTLDDEALEFKGTGKILGADLQRLTWRYFLKKDNPLETALNLRAVAADAAQTLKLLDIPLDDYIGKKAIIDLELEERQDGRFQGTVTLDLNQSVIDIPYINYKKAAGAAAQGRFTMRGGAQIEAITAMKLSGDAGLNIEGDLSFRDSADGAQLVGANFPTVKTEHNDFRLRAEIEGSNNYKISIEGQRLDGRYFLQRDKTELVEEAEKSVKEAGFGLKISLGIQQIQAAEGTKLNNAAAYVHQASNGSLKQFDMDCDTPDGRIRVRYKDSDEDGETFQVRSNDAGYALRALGVSDNFQGGRLFIMARTGAFEEQLNRLAGDFLLRDFKLIKAPTLARIINALSIEGLGELLRPGSGLEFERMGTQFVWNSDKGEKIVEIRNTKARGASLGLTFDGRVNISRDLVDGRGTIVPVSDLNHLLGRIPIIGQIITGGRGDAVFAATYTVRGALDEPTVQVNPLAALAPGFLRRLFFEREPTDRDEDSFPQIND